MQDIAGFEGYESPLLRRLLFYAGGVLTCGLLFLFAHWFLELKLRLLLKPCSLQQAQYVVVTVSSRHCNDNSAQRQNVLRRSRRLSTVHCS